jgi:hypothetical protein
LTPRPIVNTLGEMDLASSRSWAWRRERGGSLGT